MKRAARIRTVDCLERRMLVVGRAVSQTRTDGDLDTLDEPETGEAPRFDQASNRIERRPRAGDRNGERDFGIVFVLE